MKFHLVNLNAKPNDDDSRHLSNCGSHTGRLSNITVFYSDGRVCDDCFKDRVRSNLRYMSVIVEPTEEWEKTGLVPECRV